jgi:SAM-dependent methyltransferase
MSRLEADLGASKRSAARRRRRRAPYVVRNRRAWDSWAPAQVARGRASWSADDLCWGLWDAPEARLQLLRDVAPEADVIELGCGTAAISAWLARTGRAPVALDVSQAQLDTAKRLQDEFEVAFPLVRANAEDVPFGDERFDLAVSEYGASLWCDPRRWLPEAHRLLRPGGKLVFFTSSPFLLACTPEDGGMAGDALVGANFAPYRVEFAGEETVEFHPTHSEWIGFLRGVGFMIEDLREVRPARGAVPRFSLVSTEWALRWPSEEIWVVRKAA